MNSQSLTAVYLDGKYRVAQYGYCDGMPSIHGAIIIKFLGELLYPNDKRNMFIAKLRDLSFYTAEEWHEVVNKFNAIGSVKFNERHPELDIRTGPKILDIIYRYQFNSQDWLKLRDRIEFVRDSLFCEWCYVIDFDRNTFEVFKGFNIEPLSSDERFAKFEPISYDGDINQFYQMKFFKSYPLDKLPSKEQLVIDCDPPEVEDNAAA